MTKQTRSVLSQCRPSAPASFAPKACDVRLIPGKGLGVIATRDLAPNALVFVDSPLLIYEASDRGMKRSQADAILRHAISHLRPELQERFNALSNAFAGAESTLGRVETNGAPVISFEGAGLDADAVTYTGVFPLYSRLNHACDANARPEWDWKRLQLGVRTNRAVKAGEELCVSYIVPQQKRRERQEELMVKVSVTRGTRPARIADACDTQYRFLCQCTWCSLSDEDSAKMDIERERQAAAFLKQWHAQNAER